MRPTPGELYTVLEGDTLRTIATAAYGLGDNWPLIRNANQFEFKTDDLECVQPGEVLRIPYDPVMQELESTRLS